MVREVQRCLLRDLTLHWTESGSKLGGSIVLSNPRGKYGISGSVHGSAITFGAVGAGGHVYGLCVWEIDVGPLPHPGGRRSLERAQDALTVRALHREAAWMAGPTGVAQAVSRR